MEEEKGCEFCLVTVNFECVEKKTMSASNCPGGEEDGDSSVSMRGTQRDELGMS